MGNWEVVKFRKCFLGGVTVHSNYIMSRYLVIRPRDNKSCRRYAREFLGCSSCLSPTPFFPRHLKSRSNCQQIFLKASAEGQQKEEGLSEADARCAARRKRNEFFPLRRPCARSDPAVSLFRLRRIPEQSTNLMSRYMEFVECYFCLVSSSSEAIKCSIYAYRRSRHHFMRKEYYRN